MSVGPLYVLFGEMSIQVFCQFLIGLFVFLVLSCMSSLYILDINPLSDVSLVNTFFHSVGCLLILLMVSFAVQKLFSLMCSHLFIFAFAAFAQGDISKKILLRSMSKSLLPVFSSKSLWFQVLYLMQSLSNSTEPFSTS